jgi:D-amino-acid dehydrogenase
MPGIAFDLIRMISQPNPPFSIRPAYLPKIFPWLLRFIWQSRASAAKSNAIHLRALSKRAATSWRLLTDNTKLTTLIADAGWLKVYETQEAFAATLKARQLMDEVGTKFEVLSDMQIRDLEPNLAPLFKYGFYQKDCLNIINPQRLVCGMVDLFVDRGGRYQQFGVDVIRTENGQVSLSGSKGNFNRKTLWTGTGTGTGAGLPVAYFQCIDSAD